MAVKACVAQLRGPEFRSTELTQMLGDCGSLPIIPASDAYTCAQQTHSHTQTKQNVNPERSNTPELAAEPSCIEEYAEGRSKDNLQELTLSFHHTDFRAKLTKQ